MSAELFVHRSRDITACALYEDGVPTELFAVREEKKAAASGDILIGRVANTDASGTMTFVDIGEEKKAVLFSADRLPEARLSQGDSVLVQIKHEAAGTKGAMLTMHVSFAGKAVVLMPHENFVKLSKNIEDEGRRMRLKALGKSLTDRFGCAFIMRNSAAEMKDDEIFSEAETLFSEWTRIKESAAAVRPPQLIKNADDPVERILKRHDASVVYSNAEGEYPTAAERIKAAAKAACAQRVELECGGYVIEDKTEALTVFDVNSGSSTCGHTEVNLDAARAIMRKLRLENVGGIVIIDFIDMTGDADRERVTALLKKLAKKDSVRVTVYGFTALGLMEIARQRTVSGSAGRLLLENI